MEDKITGTSPVPQKINSASTSLSFPEAIQEIIDGNKITRLEWDKSEEYGFLAKDGFLSIHREGVDHRWMVNDGDMLATDWIVLPEAN